MNGSRRRWLQLAGACASTLWLPRGSWSQPRLADDPFSLGVASGDAGPDSVVLWTRLHRPGQPAAALGTQPLTLRWELAHDEGFARLAARGQAIAHPDLVHAVHVEVRGLEPARTYWYRFMAGDAVSPVGRTQTLPAPQDLPGRVRLAYASCQKWEDGHFTAWRHMRQDDPQGVVFLGDYLYEYPARSSRIRVPDGGWVLTLDDYRRRYAQYKGDADLQAMHAACPWWVTWDDHEVQNDYAGEQPGNSGSADPAPPGAFLARRAAAYQAWYEHMPVRASVLQPVAAGEAPGRSLRIHRRVQFGRLLDLYLLDARQYRHPQVCTRGNALGSSMVNPAQCPSWDDPARSLLGLEQERWLDAELAGSQGRGTRWQVLGQQTLFGRRDHRIGPGQSLWNDGWDGYAAARSRLTDSLRRHAVPNPVLLGGDIHENWVGHIKADYDRPDSPSLGVEFCGTSITSHSGSAARLADRLAENPHFVFADAERRGYGLVDLAPDGLQTTLRVVDDVTRRDTRIETLARFRVQAGRPVIEPA